jgi:hypothetical protein
MCLSLAIQWRYAYLIMHLGTLANTIDTSLRACCRFDESQTIELLLENCESSADFTSY